MNGIAAKQAGWRLCGIPPFTLKMLGPEVLRDDTVIRGDRGAKVDSFSVTGTTHAAAVSSDV